MWRAVPFACALAALSFFIAHLLKKGVHIKEENAALTAEAATISNIGRKEALIRRKLLDQAEHQIDELCSELDRTCFTVSDRVEERDGRLLGYRALRRKGPHGVLILSEARILPPSPLTWENFNTRTWKIIKSTMRLEYARLMVAGAFFSGALDFNTPRRQEYKFFEIVLRRTQEPTRLAKPGDKVVLLQVKDIRRGFKTVLCGSPRTTTGVGIFVSERFRDSISGCSDQAKEEFWNLLDEKTAEIPSKDVIMISVTVVDIDPVMKRVAEKWYDFKESPHHQIVVEDGVTFVHEAAVKGTKYDALLLDVCYNTQRPMMCPIEEFLTEDVIKEMRAAVSDNGAVIVNIITLKDRMGEADRMLFCSTKEGNSWLNNRDELYARYMAVDAALGFQLTLKKNFVPND
ncbi:unnamed protein product [Heligmosomoides polygyrus]|uniref:Methyltransf_21 domain-containing protein n=1 Tax=Heligmosomoides polygyrus TaxID=6339 RepID=A0A3P8CEI7_HELPZ|nr:unnamed protein product [Heligmosomoides polygyrus]